MTEPKRRRLYSYRFARRCGRRDGRNWRWRIFLFKREPKDPLPHEDERDAPPFERELQQAAEGDMQGVARRWKDEDEKLKTTYCRALDRCRRAKRHLIKEAAEAQLAQKRCEAREEQLEKIGLPHISNRARNVLLFLIAFCEFPVNLAVYRVFGESETVTMLVAAGLGAIIPLFAHFFGHSLRQDEKTTKDKRLLWVSPLVVLMLLGFISFWRGLYLSSSAKNDLLGLNVRPATAVLMFVFLNIAFFFIAMLVSYLGTHRNQPRFKQAKLAVKVARRNRSREVAEASAADTELDSSQDALMEIRNRRRQRFESLQAEARGIKETFDLLIEVYRRSNAEARPGRTPTAFKQDPPEPVFPEGLQTISWECEGIGERTADDTPPEPINREVDGAE